MSACCGLLRCWARVTNAADCVLMGHDHRSWLTISGSKILGVIKTSDSDPGQLNTTSKSCLLPRAAVTAMTINREGSPHQSPFTRRHSGVHTGHYISPLMSEYIHQVSAVFKIDSRLSLLSFQMVCWFVVGSGLTLTTGWVTACHVVTI